jgi:hypothetical protein
MPRDVIITPASGLVDFKDDAGNIDAKVQIDTTGNLSITNSGGNLTIGDSSATVYIGDGANSTDVVFEQNGAIRALTGKTLTLGASNSAITIASPTTINNTLSVTGTLTATAFSGSGTSLTGLNASNISSGTLAAARLPTGASGTWFNTIKVSIIGTDGVQEIGRYIDFHNTTTDTSDFTYRLDNTTTGALVASGTFQATQLVSSVATGTAPLTVTSTTRVANLNVATAGNADTVTDGVYLTSTQTLTNKTLTSPRIGNGLFDSNGAEVLNIVATASAVNELSIANAATGGTVVLSTAGTDTNINLAIQTKGTGSITLDTGTGVGQIDLKPGSSNIRFWDDDSSHYFQLVTGNTTANYDLTLPAASGTVLLQHATANTAGYFYTGTTNPTGTTRLNYSGYLYPTFLNLVASSDTTTAATHYFVETGSDGFVRPKTLANVRTEIVTSAAIATALTSANIQVDSLGVGTAASGVTGEIRATNAITAYYSDARLKDFHGRIDGALSKVQQLNGYYFTENETAKSLGYTNTRMQVGVSAQEVESVLPEVVTEAPISDEYKTVWYDKLVPLLIEAIKELKAEVDELRAKVKE